MVRSAVKATRRGARTTKARIAKPRAAAKSLKAFNLVIEHRVVVKAESLNEARDTLRRHLTVPVRGNPNVVLKSSLKTATLRDARRTPRPAAQPVHVQPLAAPVSVDE